MALERNRHSTSTPRTSTHPHPFQEAHLIAASAGKGSRASLHGPTASRPHGPTASRPPLVLRLRSYQITDHSCEEKDLGVAIPPITVTLPPGFLCLCPNLCQHPRLWLL